MPNCSWVPRRVPRSCSLLRATSAVTGSCRGVESEDALLCRSPWVVWLSKTHRRQARELRAREHDTRKRLREAVERLNRSCNFGSARMVLGEIVLLPAQAGGPLLPAAPPLHQCRASVSMRRKPKQKPKWSGKLLSLWKNDIIFPLDLFLRPFMVQPHKCVPVQNWRQ